MARPVLLLTRGSWYAPGWIEQHWPLLLERCELRQIDEPQRWEWLDQLAEADAVIPRRWDVDRQALGAAWRVGPCLGGASLRPGPPVVGRSRLRPSVATGDLDMHGPPQGDPHRRAVWRRGSILRHEVRSLLVDSFHPTARYPGARCHRRTADLLATGKQLGIKREATR
jgi:hypothetical protein